MKAVVYRRYGADALRCEEVEKPSPGPDQVLIRVRAASVNPYDWHFIEGKPYPLRMMFGLKAPKTTRAGLDVAGEIEAVGANVTQLEAGQAVFGTAEGSLAEYVCTAQDKVVAKPANVSSEEAASVPVGALTALQALRDKGRVQAGQTVLINGAAGGVGTFAVQIAKSFGAEVTAVCSTRNVDLVRSIGADHVIDYTRETFTRRGEAYDVVVDNIGNHSVFALRRVTKPTGKYIAVGGPDGWWVEPLGHMFKVLLASLVSKRMSVHASQPNRDDLLVMQQLLESGKVKPVIDRTYPLCDASEAVRYLETGHARGKVVLTV